jgi:predicted metalloprotease with PDZ domain
MIRYSFSIQQPQQQYIHIKVRFHVKEPTARFGLPVWRPGRYEKGNFAKNVKGLKVFDEAGKRLKERKLDLSVWEVETKNTSFLTIEYSYYAAELNAGSTYLDKDQLYVNPVNCCLYISGHEHEEIEVSLEVPEDWELATGLPHDNRKLSAANFDELADSPFICSSQLQHQSYQSCGVTFHIWFNGEVKPDWGRLSADFTKFTNAQIEKFGEFPVKEFHFLIHILPYQAYHGVEHLTSTVITLGPSHQVFQSLYKELLGVSSHELYHVWNIKSIRPSEMFPYDFAKENISSLGYIYEGVTTYLGDLFLLKSGVFSLEQYIHEMEGQLQKHADNPARFNYSVADSSFDTWLDGYVPGAPGRKVSIYTEGCLLAFVLDTMIIRETSGKSNIDEFMKRLYYNFAVKGIGYTESDILSELKNMTGYDFADFFQDYVHGTRSFEGILVDAFESIGFEMETIEHDSYSLSKLGIKTVKHSSGFKVSVIFPGSPADVSGMTIGDEILAVNSVVCSTNLDQWLTYFENDEKRLTVIRNGRLVELVIPEVSRSFYLQYKLRTVARMNRSQEKFHAKWIK